MGTRAPGSKMGPGEGGRKEAPAEQTSPVLTEVDSILLIPKAPEAGSGCCNVVYGRVILLCKA